MTSLHTNHAAGDPDLQFYLISERLLNLRETKIMDEKEIVKLISGCLDDLNKLDNIYMNKSLHHSIISSLVNELCAIVSPTETILVQSTCKFLYNVTQNNVYLYGPTFAACRQWFLEVLESSDTLAQIRVLITIRSFLQNGYLNNHDRYMESLLRNENLLKKHLNPLHSSSTEINFYALGFLEEIVINKSNKDIISNESIYLIKDIVIDFLLLLPYKDDDKFYYSKVIYLCLHILCFMVLSGLISTSPDFVGEALGIVQVFLFHGIKNYSVMKPQCLRPAAMNLPERIHEVPKCKNLKKRKGKPKKTTNKKITCSTRNDVLSEQIGSCKYSSDSDTSDTDSNTIAHIDSKVRLEAANLMQALVEITSSREIFGYWSQIVATGSRNDARVLTRSVLIESASKVKQSVLSTLTELLIGARPFLLHAEDTDNISFITFFGTVCLMIKELHFTLSLVLSNEKNIAILTHALKCGTALVQSTPYERLKPGLANKLARNCRFYIFHKDPTVQVAALSIFEAFASIEPITQEILSILGKRHASDTESEKSTFNANSVSDPGTEEEEVDIEDANNLVERFNEIDLSKSEDISLLVHISLENISNKIISIPVRLQSLKIMGRLAFNVGSLIFPYLERVTITLVSVLEESESQIVLHACRVLEIMSDCLAKIEYIDGTLFWNIIFESMISLSQSSQTILREVACDCLGSINEKVFTQLPREKAILVITILFGAIRDEESAVRAAGLRALGMLVTSSALKDDTGFLMDLADTVCLTSDDKNLGVRIKSAWALANLCDCLSTQKQHEEIEPFPWDILLPKLYRASIKGAIDNQKVKCNAVRAIGSILHLCPEKHILFDPSLGLKALINCSVLGNDMKVRWNACRALGLVLSQNPDAILPFSWKDEVFPALSTLICESPNFKVRTNAAWALSSCSYYGKYTVKLWKSIVLAFENAQHVPSYVEYPHQDALIQQLCLTLGRVAACTEGSELRSLWTEVGDHIQDISNFIKRFQETVLPEKLGDLIKAKAQFEHYAKNMSTAEERQIAQSFANIFERTNRYDNLDDIT